MDHEDPAARQKALRIVWDAAVAREWMDWRGEECADFIEGLGFPQYRSTFALNMTGKQLKLLETMHLSHANITDFKHQRIILKYVRMLCLSFPVYIKHEFPNPRLRGRAVETEHEIYVVPTMTWSFFQRLVERKVTRHALWALYASPELKRKGVLKWVNRQLKAAQSHRRVSSGRFMRVLRDGEILKTLVNHCRACLNPTTAFAYKHFGRVASHGDPTTASENDIDERALHESYNETKVGDAEDPRREKNLSVVQDSLLHLPFDLPNKLVETKSEPLKMYAFMTEIVRETSKIRNPWLNKKGVEEDEAFEDADSDFEDWFETTMVKPKTQPSDPDSFYGLKAFKCHSDKYVCIQEDWRMVESLDGSREGDGMNLWVKYTRNSDVAQAQVHANETTLETLGLTRGSIFRMLELEV